MTLEQAIEVLKDRYNSGVTRRRTDDEWRLATDTVIVALRNPIPDPDTGLVPCGCGGRAELCKAVKPNDGTSFAQCTKCTLSTAVFMSEERSRDEWNTAMGWKGGAE